MSSSPPFTIYSTSYPGVFLKFKLIGGQVKAEAKGRDYHNYLVKGIKTAGCEAGDYEKLNQSINDL